MTGKTYSTTIGIERKMFGHVVRKMPIRRYLLALRVLQDAPIDLAKELFPDKSLMDVLDMIEKKEINWVKLVAGALLQNIPDYFMELAATLLDIDREVLENDPNVGIVELYDMLEAWIEINGIADFTARLRKLTGKIKSLIPKTTETQESNNLSLSQSGLESQKEN